jgi:2-polyprenyl-6-methoxyphenol hydroxylase-like FAD-dependent oxidoreductase
MCIGDVLQLAANASRIIGNWGNALEEIKLSAASPAHLRCQNKEGEILIDQELPLDFNGFPNLYCNRGGVQKVMYNYAVSLGVEVNFGSRITRVFDDADSAGIFVGDEKVVADFVVVADGVHSKSRGYVTGITDKPQASGFAVYRSWFSMDEIRDEPLLQEIVNSKTDLFQVWIGLNTHGIVTTNVKLQTVVCFCTHKVWCA